MDLPSPWSYPGIRSTGPDTHSGKSVPWCILGVKLLKKKLLEKLLRMCYLASALGVWGAGGHSAIFAPQKGHDHSLLAFCKAPDALAKKNKKI